MFFEILQMTLEYGPYPLATERFKTRTGLSALLGAMQRASKRPHGYFTVESGDVLSAPLHAF